MEKPHNSNGKLPTASALSGFAWFDLDALRQIQERNLSTMAKAIEALMDNAKAVVAKQADWAQSATKSGWSDAARSSQAVDQVPTGPALTKTIETQRGRWETAVAASREIAEMYQESTAKIMSLLQECAQENFKDMQTSQTEVVTKAASVVQNGAAKAVDQIGKLPMAGVKQDHAAKV